MLGCSSPSQMLEDNQVLIQGMMANRYMDTFRDPILGWNKKLMAVADVVGIVAEIQVSAATAAGSAVSNAQCQSQRECMCVHAFDGAVQANEHLSNALLCVCSAPGRTWKACSYLVRR